MDLTCFVFQMDNSGKPKTKDNHFHPPKKKEGKNENLLDDKPDQGLDGCVQLMRSEINHLH